MKAWKQRQQDYTQHERVLLAECLRFTVEFLDGKHVPKKQTNRDARKRWIPCRDQRGVRAQQLVPLVPWKQDVQEPVVRRKGRG